MPEYRVTIPGWVPVSLNKFTDRHWSIRSRAKKKTAETIAPSFAVAGVPRVSSAAPIRRRVRLEITWPKGARSLDPDNLYKALGDALKRLGYLADDNLKWCEFVLPPVYLRGGEGEAETVVILEDLPPMGAMARRGKKGA